MKYLRIYENINDEVWLFIFEDVNDSSNNYCTVFNDEQSAENLYIETVNDLKKDILYRGLHGSSMEFNESDMITNIIDADNWLDDMYDVYHIQYKKTYIQGKYELRSDLKMIRDSQKYNL